MATAPTPLSAAEVAALAGLDEGPIRKDVENGIFPRPSFGFSDLVYFFAIAGLGVQLGVADRRKLHGLVTRAMKSPRPPRRIELGPVLLVLLDRASREARARLTRFESWKDKLVTDERILGGEPVFPGTRLAVRHVGAMLLGGASTDEIREDYPDLRTKDLELSAIFTKAYPRVGRPRERQAAPR